MQIKDNLKLTIKIVEMKDTEDAKNIILEGLKERFGFLDHSYNPDLNDILKNYIDNGDTFLVGFMNQTVVCTGALTKETEDIGRIQRMSVKEEFRGKGFARQMLQFLESIAKENGFKKLLLETNKEWASAIELYKSTGYSIYQTDEKSSHFYKLIE